MALFDTGRYSILSNNFFIYGGIALEYYCFMALFDTGSYSFLSINFFFYGVLSLQYYCFYLYEKLPLLEISLRKFLLRFMIWFLSTAIMSGIFCLCAPYYTTLEALPFYVLAIFGFRAFLFYVSLIDGLCCCGGERTCDFCRKVSDGVSLENLDVGSYSILFNNFFVYGFLALEYHCFMAVFDTGSYSFLSVNLFFYGVLALQYYCFYVYRKLPLLAKSLRKFLLRFMIWFLSTAIMSGIACLCAPYYTTLEALPFYVVAIFGFSAFLFYAYLIDDLCCCGGEGTCDSCRKGSEGVSLENLV